MSRECSPWNGSQYHTSFPDQGSLQKNWHHKARSCRRSLQSIFWTWQDHCIHELKSTLIVSKRSMSTRQASLPHGLFIYTVWIYHYDWVNNEADWPITGQVEVRKDLQTKRGCKKKKEISGVTKRCKGSSRWTCHTEKRYQVTWQSLGKKYGLA